MKGGRVAKAFMFYKNQYQTTLPSLPPQEAANI